MADPRRIKYPPLDYIAAGKVLERHILQQRATVSRWARECSNESPGAILDLCNGSYNHGRGPTTSMLWQTCVDLANGDEHAASLIAHEYLSALCLIPFSGEASLAAELAIGNAHLSRVASGIETMRRKQEAKARRDAARAERERIKQEARASVNHGTR